MEKKSQDKLSHTQQYLTTVASYLVTNDAPNWLFVPQRLTLAPRERLILFCTFLFFILTCQPSSFVFLNAFNDDAYLLNHCKLYFFPRAIVNSRDGIKTICGKKKKGPYLLDDLTKEFLGFIHLSKKFQKILKQIKYESTHLSYACKNVKMPLISSSIFDLKVKVEKSLKNPMEWSS